MTIAPDLPRLLTAREAADHLRITPDHLYRLVARGVLPAIRFTKGGVLRFRPADLQAALSDPVCGCRTSVHEAVEPAAPEGSARSRSAADPSPVSLEAS
jgi:excisionase family DNA binding protein